MNRLSLIALCFFSVFFHVEAQIASQDAETNAFQPSLGFVIGILGVMFLLTFVLLVYAKFCHRRSVRGDNVNHPAQIRSSSRYSGIDKTVIESLPFFRFSTLKGSKEGLECAVCLSKFEDIEILRLLPKCKHAFHINCIDHWLEKHASCPLCRQRVGSEDMKLFTGSSSMRFLWSNQSERKQDSNIELFVQREEEEEEEEQQQQQQPHGSSRFSIGRSFRKILKSEKDDEMLIQKACDGDENMKNLHRLNHKIIASDFVFMNRWSNVSSSDLMFLNKEMIGSISSSRFTSLETDIEQSTVPRSMQNEEILKIKEEMEIKRSFESKLSTISQSNSVPILGFPSTSESAANPFQTARITSPDERRSVSEITGISRFWGDLDLKFNRRDEIGEPSDLGNNGKQERMRQIWYPIAKRTVQWFANRETMSQPAENRQRTVETV